jgi:hypothetical protein
VPAGTMMVDLQDVHGQGLLIQKFHVRSGFAVNMAR